MDLEKLDETRLREIAGIYAQKRRQKQFHDAHVIMKEFKVGKWQKQFHDAHSKTKEFKTGNNLYLETANPSSKREEWDHT